MSATTTHKNAPMSVRTITACTKCGGPAISHDPDGVCWTCRFPR